jgi:hypothetical protein
MEETLRSMPPERREVVRAMMTATADTTQYEAALRDWVEKGAASPFALTPDEVVARSRPRPWEAGQAATEFELGQHLHRSGHPRDAVAHFREAHRLDPENWSYPRQALSLADQSWGKVYERDLLEEVGVVGPETFYPPLDLAPRPGGPAATVTP